ncbi:Matrix-remodeling-associated protein 8 [Oryzias melastigma]|uniref:Matrix remodeling-associated protein 8 n=1 Tax=Oryzias melastigma TaxID=30732 RepID=A0A3B3BCU6_ORYME|nr:matrix remodeling-associated protein 8 [Oryzias melastigma]KAF6721238.1 Matrix-remodeling-associated protein 8 [Oryzias melastigma]
MEKKMQLCITVLQILAVFSLPGAWAQSGGSSSSSSSRLGVVVEAKNITLPAGSQAVLPCHSTRMVWTRDRLKDRQRVVHWDLLRTTPEYFVERILDMSPGARLRVYNGFNKGRVSIPDSAFTDGNFSLVINNVLQTDKGVYTCNLHHHYCQIHQSIQIQLNVTKSARKEKRYWDGEKTVYVVLLGSSVVLPCVNRRPLWREGLQEDQQQVAHWDFQPPGVRPDRADRLVDLYGSGERRDYGPLFSQKMSVPEDAFTFGDFSLQISDLKPVDKGLYSCHLHHHYCGLHERRIFRLTVGPPLPLAPTETPDVIQNNNVEPSTEEVLLPRESPHVLNVFLPEHQGHFVQYLGYILATFLLLIFIVVVVIVLTRRRKKRDLECELSRSVRGTVTEGGEIALDYSEMKSYNQDPMNSDYKNNLLKEKDMAKDCNKDFDGKMWK